MKKAITVLLVSVFVLTVCFTACGTSASSTLPSSSAPESSQSIKPLVPPVPAESEPVVSAEETATQLQGVWGYDDGESFVFRVFEEGVCYSLAGYWAPSSPAIQTGTYTVDGSTITASFMGQDTGGTVTSDSTDTAEISPDGTTMMITNENTTYELEKRLYPMDVDYYGGYEDWGHGYAEVGLRLRVAPNTDAEIITSVDHEPITDVRILGTSQVDPTWLLVLYGSQVGFASSEHLQFP